MEGHSRRGRGHCAMACLALWLIRLELNVRNLSLGRRHLVNAYEVKADIGVIVGKTVIHA